MEIKFLDVGCGDGIHIRFYGDDNRYHNTLIDGGIEKGDIYNNTLRKEIAGIKERNEHIDLWIITHIDDDHIGGILRFIKDKEMNDGIDLSMTRFWYNYSNLDYDTKIKTDNFKSVTQGIALRNYITGNSIVNQFITDELQRIQFFGVSFCILSPNRENFEKLVRKWKKEEIKIVEKEYADHKTAGENDYAIKLTDFDLEITERDTSTENASSLAFIIEYKKRKFLFTADSHPWILANALLKLGYTPTNKLHLDYMQLAHHGSKFNTNDKLLEFINCSNYIISGDGYNKHNLPNKKTLARVLAHNSAVPVNFFITQKNDLTKSIFDVDGSTVNTSLHFPLSGSNALIFNLNE